MAALERADPTRRVFARMAAPSGTAYVVTTLDDISDGIRAARRRRAKILDGGNHAPLTARLLLDDVDALIYRGWWVQAFGAL